MMGTHRTMVSAILILLCSTPPRLQFCPEDLSFVTIRVHSRIETLLFLRYREIDDTVISLVLSTLASPTFTRLTVGHPTSGPHSFSPTLTEIFAARLY